jgi:4-amino-4-deoxy-L-arabinose transferase-like glycosyltransferase
MTGFLTACDPGTDRPRPERRSWNYRLGRSVVLHYRSCLLLVMALTTFNVFWHLSTTAISSLDEARYGVAASEMLNAHELLVPTYGGRTEYWNLKPPLGYWLIEASYVLFGRSVWALRLTSALCACSVVLLTMSWCRRRFGRRAAILAGVMVATCFGFLSNHGARSGDLDAALTLIVMLALFQVPSLRSSATSRLMWSLLLALGFLLKSFAILPFALAATIYLAWSGGERIPWWRWMPAIVLFVGIVGGWALMRTIEDGTPYFVIRMSYEDLFMRATHAIDHNSYAPWGYAAALLDRFAPWPILILLGWCVRRSAVQARTQQSAGRLLLLWALVPLCLFSLARTQHHWYLDPTYPAWAMLAAIALLKVSRCMQLEFNRIILLCLTVLALLGCEWRFLQRLATRDQMPKSQLFLASLADCRDVRHERLYTTFPLSHSERFLLQVVDGFDVREPTPDADNTILPQPRLGLVLVSKHPELGGFTYPYSNPAVVAQSADYLLVDGHASAGWLSSNAGPDVYGPALRCEPFDGGLPEAMGASSKAGVRLPMKDPVE